VIIIESQAVGPFFKNGFVVACPHTLDGVIIDPGDEVRSLLEYAKREHIQLTRILLTHAHVDHVTGVGIAKRALDVPIHLHADDQFLYDRAADQARMFGLQVPEPLPPIDVYYSSGEVIELGQCDIRPHHTPGHCPGGVCLQIGERGQPARDLFVGDTLFAGSIGRTDLPGGDYATLIGSIRSVLFPFGDDARVHPGHGPSTTIGQERRTNPFLQAI
jgi:hydroxyacylglutathione hydrolase